MFKVFAAATPHSDFIFRTKMDKMEPNKSFFSKSLYPIPVFTTKYKKCLVDHVKQQIHQKEKYRDDVKSSYRSAFYDHRQKKHDIFLTPKTQQYVEILALDPAPYIKGRLDWNFNRGNLAIVDDYLVKVNDQKSFKLLEATPKMTMKCDKLNETEDNFANQIMINGKFIGMRRKNLIRIGKIDELEDDEVISASDLYNFANVDEIIASTMFNNQLVALDSNEYLTRYDLETKSINYKYQFPKNTSRFRCQLPFSLSAVKETKVCMKITYTNCYEFGFLDCRIQQLNKLTYFPFESIFNMTCEKIFNHCHSLINKNLTYVISSHFIYCMDMRKFDKPVIQWAHQITKPPMMFTNTLLNDTEIFCAASYVPEDLKVFNFDGTSANYFAFQPLNIQKSFHHLREEGHFLLSDNIKERINMSITGIALKSDEENRQVRLFTQNAVGDIFESRLLCTDNNSSSDEKELYEKFKGWDWMLSETKNANDFVPLEERIERKELVFNEIIQLSGIAKIFTCDALQTKKEDIENDDMNMITEKKPRWKIDIEEARSYKDLLAQEIMNVWDDIDIEDLKPSLFAEALEITEQENENTSDRVAQWLQNTQMNETVDDINFSESLFFENTSTQLLKTETLKEPAVETQTTINDSQTTKKVKKKKPRMTGF